MPCICYQHLLSASTTSTEQPLTACAIHCQVPECHSSCWIPKSEPIVGYYTAKTALPVCPTAHCMAVHPN